ncbi:MAG: topoisomerase C-terminal repeat-containing protein, partial [Myxococcota bacterium]
IDARAVNTIVLGEDKDGLAIQVRVGRKFGPYLVRGEDTAQIPEKMPPDELTLDKAIELLDAPSSDRQVGVDAESGLPVLLRTSQYGAYVQLGEKPEDGSKPKTASLFKSMDPAELTVEDALRLLSLPRAVGVAEDGEEILARNGKFGPYISKGKESRTLPSEESIFTVTVAEALELLSKAPTRRRRAAAEPLRELGEDTVSGQTITLRKGRFGPYVTDGETNASLRSSDDPDTLTQERAQELLQLRREAGPSKKRTKKAASKKKKTTTKKKASSKKDAVEATPVTKKKTSKKAATKKASKKKKASS